ncbi:UNVERIFIED_ORG: putative endonuclease [Methylobacterium sp. SuP10 SLI 274]|uniref:YraN family protein n=1 Tax=Methylorubrum extorquens TaxID=408 RepID=UPI0020A0F939|nr:YraN family protein [Methylorubrum extorquens]MDF9862183.1 putative endonuclease [Methylorubrum pseudosasae]MDH6635802.1 putative endonuclease [Methylobacterium sp. SuP10 SLI 274]MDH6664976.1 putative endonuclease [Methylorubrum zatmanii]MCP1556904.1 putative endonuclease [Methylorubrum extorquens]MDF9790480.1 putative endonuclease [Methylorubrum extorquens]
MKTPADPGARRRATHGRGLSAEGLALLVLMLKGYRPLARRFAAAGGEIDLIVRRGRTIAFVEVKARATLDAAATAIDARKRARLSRAARAWLARHPLAADATLRADAVFVAPRRWPRHLPNAFEIEGL